MIVGEIFFCSFLELVTTITMTYQSRINRKIEQVTKQQNCRNDAESSQDRWHETAVKESFINRLTDVQTHATTCQNLRQEENNKFRSFSNSNTFL